MIAKEKFAFTKMQPLCDLEEKHGVDLGTGYRNDHTWTSVKPTVKLFRCDAFVHIPKD